MIGRVFNVTTVVSVALLLAAPLSFARAAEANTSFSCVAKTAKRAAMIVQVKKPDTLIAKDGFVYKLANLHLPLGTITLNNRNDGRLPRRSFKALERLILNKIVTIHISDSKKDRYGATAAQIFLPATARKKAIWVQAEMVQLGLARVFPEERNGTCSVQLMAIETTARAQSIGLWKDEFYKIIQADNLKHLYRSLGQMQLVEGVVQSVSVRRARSYINFSKNWKRDFTVTISARVHKIFTKKDVNPEALAGKRIRVRGWLDRRNGPTIAVSHVAQIEILNE